MLKLPLLLQLQLHATIMNVRHRKRCKQQSIFFLQLCNALSSYSCLTLSACFTAARNGTQETIRSTLGTYSDHTVNRNGASIQFPRSTFRRGSSSTRVDTTIAVAQFPCPSERRLKQSELSVFQYSEVLKTWQRRKPINLLPVGPVHG